MRILERFSIGIVAFATVASALAPSGFAQLLYDNSDTTKFTGQYYGATTEFGDQIKLTSGAGGLITSFKFDYYLGFSGTGNETLDLRLYANSAGGAPGALLYDSGAFSIAANRGYANISASGLSINAPNTLTWTVLFGNVNSSEQYGLLFYSTPTVGSSFDDYWEKDASGNWVTKRFSTSGGPIANFGATVTGITAVPEPGTLGLGLFGGLGLLGLLARRKQVAEVR